MTQLAERPHLPLRLARTGLEIALGQQGGHGYRVTLEPAVARQFALGLLEAADAAEIAAEPVLAELAAIAEVNRDG